MKVLSYLEYNSKNYSFAYSEIRFYNELFKSYNESSANFYSQPFKPELIPELFEGWELRQCDAYLLLESYIKGEFAQYRLYKDNYNLFYKGSSKGRIPRTLDDFINDCKRALIELEWRIKK